MKSAPDHALGAPAFPVADRVKLAGADADAAGRPSPIFLCWRRWPNERAPHPPPPCPSDRRRVFGAPRQCSRRDRRTHLRLSFGPFTMTPAGLFAEVPKSKQVLWLSSRFDVVGRKRDPSSRDWGLLLQFRDDDGQWHDVVVPDAALHGDRAALCGNLASQGLRIVTTSTERGWFVRYLNEFRTADRVTAVPRTGWHLINGSLVFVHPAGSFGVPANEVIHLEAGTRSPYGQAGTLAEWQTGVGAMIAGHSRLVLLCSCAFAGPLLYLAGHEGGGVHVFGDSSSGKTTAARVAGSVWGSGGTPGYVLSWNQTGNALEAILAERTDTVAVYDEIGVGEAKAIASGLYQLTAGTGKNRLNRESRLCDPRTWRTVLISTGEVSVSSKIAEQQGGRAFAGQQVRALDIPADAGHGIGIFDPTEGLNDPGAFAERLKQAVTRNFGTAGPAFIERLMKEGPEEVGATVREMMDAFEKSCVPANANGQVRRAGRFLALVGAAGELATLGHRAVARGRGVRRGRHALKAWIGGRGGVEAAEIHDGIEQVRSYLSAYGESHFDPAEVVIRLGSHPIVPDGAGAPAKTGNGGSFRSNGARSAKGSILAPSRGRWPNANSSCATPKASFRRRNGRRWGPCGSTLFQPRF